MSEVVGSTRPTWRERIGIVALLCLCLLDVLAPALAVGGAIALRSVLHNAWRAVLIVASAYWAYAFLGAYATHWIATRESPSVMFHGACLPCLASTIVFALLQLVWHREWFPEDRFGPPRLPAPAQLLEGAALSWVALAGVPTVVVACVRLAWRAAGTG